MDSKNLKVGDTFTQGNEIFEVLEIVSLGYNVKRIAFVDEKKPVNEEKEEAQLDSFNKYTKTEINRLNVSELEKVCDQLGLEKSTGMAMKKAIIEKLGL